MGNHFLSLSLFVILLCFFIVLNTYSNYDKTKSGSVLDSLNLAFSNEVGSVGVLSTQFDQQVADGSSSQGSVMERVRGVFSARIPALEASMNRFGNEMRVRVPRADFEDALREEALSGEVETKLDLRRALIAVMDQAPQSRLRLDIFYELPENPAREAVQNPARMAEYMRAAAQTALKLEAAGLPPEMLSVGVIAAEDSDAVGSNRAVQPKVLLHFSPLTQFDAASIPEVTP
jgi:hypothetical protein